MRVYVFYSVFASNLSPYIATRYRQITELTPDNFGSRTRRAIGLVTIIRVVGVIAQVATSVVLARLLMPEDFGIVGMATMITGVGGLLRDMGLRQALIQRRALEQKHLVAAFWASLLLGALMCGTAVLAAPWAGSWFGEPRMAGVLQLLSVTFLISPFETVPGALLERQLEFRKQFWPSLSWGISYGIIAIALSLAGVGYWSMVIATIASSAIGTAGVCFVARYVPPIMPSLAGIGDLYSFGLGVTGAGIASFVADQMDYLIVGRWLNSAALGLYTRAFTLAHMPTSQLGSTVSVVLLPAFSHLQGEPQRAQGAFLRTIATMSTLSYPSLSLLAVISPEFVQVVFGQKWTGAVIPLQVLCLAAMVKCLSFPASSLMRATGRAGAEAVIRLVYAIAVAGLAIVGIRWGIVGVAASVVVASGIQLSLMLRQVALILACTPSHYWAALREPLLLSAIAVGASVACRAIATHHNLTPAVSLMVTCTTVAVILAALVLCGAMGRTRELIDSLLTQLRSRHT